MGYLATILKRYNIILFCRITYFNSAYIYGSNFIAKFLWESGFLRGFHETPRAPTEVKVPWSQKLIYNGKDNSYYIVLVDDDLK